MALKRNETGVRMMEAMKAITLSKLDFEFFDPLRSRNYKWRRGNKENLIRKAYIVLHDPCDVFGQWLLAAMNPTLCCYSEVQLPIISIATSRAWCSNYITHWQTCWHDSATIVIAYRIIRLANTLIKNCKIAKLPILICFNISLCPKSKRFATKLAKCKLVPRLEKSIRKVAGERGGRKALWVTKVIFLRALDVLCGALCAHSEPKRMPAWLYYA